MPQTTADLLSSGPYEQSTLLRRNRGMLRDAWVETGKETVLVIRQIKMVDDHPEQKQFRLVGDEINTLFELMKGIVNAANDARPTE